MNQRTCPGCGIRKRVDGEGRIAAHDTYKLELKKLVPCSGSGRKPVATVKVRGRLL